MARARQAKPQPAAVAGLIAAELVALEGNDSVVLKIGGEPVRARVDGSVHRAVIEGAFARRERVVAQKEDDGWVVLGALRVAPTPGIDTADEYVVRARRVRIEADDDVRVVSGLASITVRAYGYVETIAEQITSRASSIHKIVGRLLHLN